MEGVSSDPLPLSTLFHLHSFLKCQTLLHFQHNFFKYFPRDLDLPLDLDPPPHRFIPLSLETTSH